MKEKPERTGGVVTKITFKEELIVLTPSEFHFSSQLILSSDYLKSLPEFKKDSQLGYQVGYKEEFYGGFLENGEKHGFGVYFGPNGKLRYIGFWHNGVMHGKGVQFGIGGESYEGSFWFGL